MRRDLRSSCENRVAFARLLSDNGPVNLDVAPQDDSPVALDVVV